MKKYLIMTIVSVIITLMFNNILLAQDVKENRQNDKIIERSIKGLKIGYNIVNSNNSFLLSDVETIKEKSFGLYLSTPINSHFSIQPEILFIKKGWEYNFSLVDADGSFSGTTKPKIELTYIEIPILIKYSIQNLSKLKFYFAPTIGYLQNAEFISSVLWTDPDEFKNSFNKFEFGAGFGVGYIFNLGKNQMTIDVRFTKGMSNIYKDEAFPFKNKVISFYVGYGL